MSRIDDRIPHSVFYLFPSEGDAEEGNAFGGTGFRVSVQSETHPDMVHLYGVSNKHVVGSSPVIRTSFAVTAESGKLVGSRKIIPFATKQWVPHDDPTVDLSVVPLGLVAKGNDPRDFVISIPSFLLLTREVIKSFNIGLGDDVYMVGRFMHHGGKILNQPSARSGIISLMPTLVEIERGKPPEEVFLVEMRSICGHSGSPVIWRLPINHSVIQELERGRLPESSNDTLIGPWLLGVDCGMFPMFSPVCDVTKDRAGQKHYQPTKFEAEVNAGVSFVVPGWRVQEVLNYEVFDMARKQADKNHTERQQGPVPRRTVASVEEDRPVFTQESFEDALKKVSRKTSEPES